jgi:hypothetical protein
MSLIAKPIVKNQLWLITDGNSKVGNLQSTGEGFNLKIGNNQVHFDSTKTIEKMLAIEFQRPHTSKKISLPYATWPTDGKTFNNVFDIKKKIHLYTKTKKSRCFHAAGYFKIKLNNGWGTIFCPKYIFIQRYEYKGPFRSTDEADNS